MYAHYMAVSMGKSLPIPAMTITILQIAQMVVGVAVVVFSISCSSAPINHWFALGMYASYFVLFSLFFVRRYFGGQGNYDDIRRSRDYQLSKQE